MSRPSRYDAAQATAACYRRERCADRCSRSLCPSCPRSCPRCLATQQQRRDLARRRAPGRPHPGEARRALTDDELRAQAPARAADLRRVDLDRPADRRAGRRRDARARGPDPGAHLDPQRTGTRPNLALDYHGSAQRVHRPLAAARARRAPSPAPTPSSSSSGAQADARLLRADRLPRGATVTEQLPRPARLRARPTCTRASRRRHGTPGGRARRLPRRRHRRRAPRPGPRGRAGLGQSGSPAGRWRACASLLARRARLRLVAGTGQRGARRSSRARPRAARPTKS